MILYSFRRCPYAMRARMALLVNGKRVELREIMLRDKPADMLARSPKGTVPVLLLPDGRVIDQSIAIMRWALADHDPEQWLAGDDERLIATNDGPFKHHLDRTKYASRHGADPIAHRNAAVALLEPLERRLEATAQLCGATRSLADMAIFPFVRQFAATEPAWFAEQRLPRLRAWLEGHLASELFARAMIRHKPWQDGDIPILLS